MPEFALCCYHQGIDVSRSCFYILSRGRNSGRPAYSPYRNSYLFTCPADDLEGFFNLVYLLWFSRAFVPTLHGTCIPFARIGDIRQLITEHSPKLAHIGRSLVLLHKLQDLETHLHKQLLLIDTARNSLLHTGPNYAPQPFLSL